MSGVRDLVVYQKAFALAMEIFRMTRGFPKEDRLALVDQMLRSSRSVTAQLAEGYRKRRYEAHWILKLTDADAENSGTQTWLEYALACGNRRRGTRHADRAIERSRTPAWGHDQEPQQIQRKALTQLALTSHHLSIISHYVPPTTDRRLLAAD